MRRGRLGNGRTADELLRVNVRGGYGGLACTRDGIHRSWQKWNCVGSAGSASSVGSAGCADKCVGSTDKCVGSVYTIK